MQLIVNVASDAGTEDVGKILGRSLLDGGKRAKMLEEQPPALYADAGQFVEFTSQRSPRAAPAMRRD